MMEGLEEDILAGFSDEDIDVNPTNVSEGNGTSQMNRTESPGIRDIPSLLIRMKEMENEIATLRKQKVKENSGVNEGQVLSSNGHKRSTKTNPKTNHTTDTSFKRTSSTDHVSAVEQRTVAHKIISQRHEDKKSGVMTEVFSGLRIRNPLISSELMKQRMEGRKMIRVKNISSKVKNGDIEGDWVTIAVVVDKLPPRDTVKGKKYAIWKLSDLSGQNAVSSLFLFSEAFQSHWKTSTGTVVAMLNPNIMPDREPTIKSASKHSDVALSIDNSKKMMILGTSQDFTVCKGVTKGGKRCMNFANQSDGGYCDYHTNRAYNSSCSSRMEFQNGYGPSVNKGTLKQKLFQGSKTEVYYYGGQSYAAPSKSSSAHTHHKTPSSRLFAPGAKLSADEVKRKQKLKEVETGVPMQEGSEVFAKLMESQRPGAKMLKKQRDTSKDIVSRSKLPGKSPSDLLKEHQRSLPFLGRGTRPGDLVHFPNTSTSLAKVNAVSLVKKKGRISHSNPSTFESENKINKIVKRVQENRDDIDDVSDCLTVQKKPKRNNIEITDLINAKSSHSWINEEAELKREEEYFERLEKKENIELKKNSITELRITVVQCKECNYIAESPGEMCKTENHHLSRFKATKKGFTCKECNQKAFTYNSRMPVDCCKKCGGRNYEQASIYYERKGPTLPTEELLLRGIEETFLN